VIGKVHHIAIAVHSISGALPAFADALGLTVTHTEEVDSQGVRVAILPVGATWLELIEPLDEASPVGRFLSRHGEGIHHICFEVDDLEATLAQLKEHGMRLVDDKPRQGVEGARIAFVHPASTHGVLIELHDRCSVAPLTGEGEMPLATGSPHHLPESDGSRGLERGIVQVYTGNGKGKTTAALGLALRAAGQGLRVHIVQFMKGWPYYGELGALQHQPNITLVQFGRAGFVNRQNPDPEDVQRAQEALRHSLDVLHDGQYDVVILDEINVALDFHLVSLEQVLGLFEARPPHVELVLTGRNAHPQVIARADLVTEMVEVKHPYSTGVQGRKGIEY